MWRIIRTEELTVRLLHGNLLSWSTVLVLARFSPLLLMRVFCIKDDERVRERESVKPGATW